jgi:S1-C subfamily serine protease
VYRGTYFPTSGSGFFVHPDGYILTNWHVIANQIEMRVFGEDREISTNILAIEAVLHSGTPNERVVSAHVVARDRDHDLALVKIDLTAPAWLSVTNPPPVKITDKVWVVGYPFGGLLALENNQATSNEDANPEVTVNSGLITSLRHDQTGKTASLQIDAAVNPGNSGGPLLDDNGRVIGVIRSMIYGGQGLGFAIAPDVVEGFARSRAIRVEFEPRVVLSPPRPIRVTVNPILASVAVNGSATVTFESRGLQRVMEKLDPQPDGSWSAVVDLPESFGQPSQPDEVIAEIRFIAVGDQGTVSRKYRLDRLKQGDVERLNSQREAGEIMRDRQLLPNEVSLKDRAAIMRQQNTRLSDVAGSLGLDRGDDQTITIDHEALRAAKKRDTSGPSQRYARLRVRDQRFAAGEVDYWRNQIDALEPKLRWLERAARNAEPSDRARANQALAVADADLKKAKNEVEAARREARRLNLVFCSDAQQWFEREAAPQGCESATR